MLLRFNRKSEIYNKRGEENGLDQPLETMYGEGNIDGNFRLVLSRSSAIEVLRMGCCV